jgi:peptidoglycan/xylan/chitin deacetylase (PgdA/CDA1 family)
LCEHLGMNDFGEINDLMLTWGQVREMSNGGISFGAHTMSHPVLARLSLEKAQEEVSESKKKIEAMIGKQVDSFSYPFGKRTDYSKSLIPLLREMHFECAVTTEALPNRRCVNLFELHRYPPWGMMFLNSGGAH